MSPGLVVLLVAVALAAAFGLYRASTDGRFRGTRDLSAGAEGDVATPTPSPAPSPTAWDSVAPAAEVPLGQKATLVQFSSAFCAPCRATRRILTDVAEVVPGVVHVEIDAEHHLELVRELGILRTPTTLVLDADGAETTRAVGAPKKEQVLQALAATSA